MADARSPGNLVEQCRSLARSRPRETAYVWLRDGEVEERALTWADLDRGARRVAAGLQARGWAGERALLVHAPGLEFVQTFLGCHYAGVTPVPLVPPRGAYREVLAAIAGHAAPAALLTERALLDAHPDLVASLAPLEVLATDGLADELADAWCPFTPEPDDLALLQYTSGSTGAPKGVEVSHGNLWRNEEMIRAAFGNGDDTVFVSWLPVFHDMGLVGNLLQPLFLGVPCVLMAPTAFVQKPVRWLRALSRYGGTVSGGPNFGYELCVQRVRDADLAGLDLSRWRVAYNGSEPVRAATLERFAERFASAGLRPAALYPCYGMAEASLFVTGGASDAHWTELAVDGAALEQHRVEPCGADAPSARRLVGCGRPWLDQQVVVVDPRTQSALAEGEVGEIWLTGGNVARGYRGLPPGEPDPFRAHLADGRGPFLRTGDLGFLHAGELFVTGRIKDVLIQNGRNVYPHDLELAAAHGSPDLRPEGAAAFAVDDGDAERLVIVAEVDRAALRALGGPDRDAAARELTAAVRAAVAERFGLRVWRVVLLAPGRLPRTSSGKVRRAHCRELFQRGELEELGARHEVLDPHLPS